MKALVLSGGGARGAYQVGVLKALGDLALQHKLTNPFGIFCGASAGAINASFLAASAEDFYLGTRRLVDLWSNLTSEQVFYTDALSLGKIGLGWMGDLSIGALGGTAPGRSLLDTTPLKKLIENNLDFSKIQKNLNDHRLKALAITALDYRTSETITFVQGDPDLNNWVRTRRRSEKSFIQAEHILASSAIPILFPPVNVGNRYFGDGCVRNMAPLSPAIYLGAQEMLVIGVRQQSPVVSNTLHETAQPPSLARVINMILNSVLLDGIEVDYERMQRINEFLRRVPPEHQTNLNFKPTRALLIHPSADIGQMASSRASRLPRVIRYLLKGLGPLDDASEIISYLMFEPEFTKSLIDLGHQDAMAREEDLTKFLLESQPQSLDWEGF